MKFKTLISSSLAIGFLFNTALPSIANTLSDDTRYETLEGEQITIDNSTEGELVEIEVFGNTVQDENNLEDIQSVGDLYVDENGNPILDNQGREQYKIDIISQNSINYFPSYTLDSSSFSRIENLSNIKVEGDYITYEANGSWTGLTTISIPIKKGVKYTGVIEIVENTLDNNVLQTLGFSLPVFRDSDRTGVFYNTTIAQTDMNTQLAFKISNENISGKIKFRIAYYEGKENCIIDEKAEGITILLPIQLQKVGNIADRLYWDNEKERYIIEKNIAHTYIKDIGKTGWYTNPNWSNGMHFKYGEVSAFNFNVYEKQFSTINSLSGHLSNGMGYNACGVDLHNRIVIELSENGISDFDEVWSWVELNNPSFYAVYWNPKYIETNITSKLKIPTYDGKTYVFIDSKNGINPTLKVTVDRTINRAKEAIATAKANPTMENISLARMWTNLIKESTIKDSLQEDISGITEIVDLTIEKKTTTANLDLYVKSNNSLAMSLSTNSVTFENYSGVEDLEMLDAVNITVNSSLPYSLNAYMPTPISNADGSNTMDANILNIRDNSKSNYSQFINTTNKVVLKDDCEAGNNNIHNIDLKLSGNNLHEADVYKTVIKFEAEQK